MNRYLAISFILITAFLVLASLVSPKINPKVSETALDKADYFLFLQINDSHYKPLDQFMLLMSKFGREIVWTVTAIALLVFGGPSGRKAAIVMAIAIIVLIPVGIIAKEVVGRIRPTIPENDFLIAPDKEHAFPSGHAQIVSAGAAVVLALFNDSFRKLLVSLSLTIEAGLVCFSRVYVGGHYPSDVVGGILLGVAVAFIFVSSNKTIDHLLRPVARALKR